MNCAYLAGRAFYEQNDFERAKIWFSRAAEYGHRLSHLYLGYMSKPEDAVPHLVEAQLCDGELLPEVLDELHERAENGCHTAATVFADLVVTYYREDVKKLEQAALLLQDTGEVAHKTSAGELWYELAGKQTNEDERLRYLDYAYDAGKTDYKTTRELADLCLKSKATEQRGLKLLEECAEESAKDALTLAKLLVDRKSYKKARKILADERLKDNPQAAFMRAGMFVAQHGKHLGSEEIAQALVLYQAAVSLGHAGAVQKVAQLQQDERTLQKWESLLGKIDSIQQNNPDESKQIEFLMPIFKTSLEQGADVVCSKIMCVFHEFKNFDALVNAASGISVLEGGSAQLVALALANGAIVRYQTEVVDMHAIKNSVTCNLPGIAQSIQAIVAQHSNAAEWETTIKKHIMPLVDARAKQGDPVACEVKSTWLEAQLLRTQNTDSESVCLKESDQFWQQLKDSEVSDDTKKVFLYRLGKTHLERFRRNTRRNRANFESAMNYFETGYTTYGCYLSGQQYAQCLFSLMMAQKGAVANKTWKDVIRVYRACADPEKGNNVDLQELLAEGYFFGENKPIVSGRYLPKKMKLAEKYARWAIANGSKRGHQMLGLCLESTNKKLALEHLMIAFGDPKEWGAMPTATRIKKKLEPKNTVIKKCWDVMQNIAASENPLVIKVGTAAKAFDMARKITKQIIEQAEIEDGRFVDPLVRITVLCFMRALEEKAETRVKKLQKKTIDDAIKRRRISLEAPRKKQPKKSFASTSSKNGI